MVLSNFGWHTSKLNLRIGFNNRKCCGVIIHPRLYSNASKLSFEDHRVIAQRQKLFITDPRSPGSTFFLPHGARIYNRLVDFLKLQYRLQGFEEVMTPMIFKKDLWERSGHWQNYEKEIFRVEGSKKVEENEEEKNSVYGLKPMNCPGHCLLYSHTERSYRDLPLRFADFSPLHRNEASGALSGLTRLRCFHQDDGHIFCEPEQIKSEIKKTLHFIKHVYSLLGMNKLKYFLSTRPEDSIGSLETWKLSEDALKEALNDNEVPWVLNEGDGAFYGPKIDVNVADARGKWHQTATIQLDFHLPQRFQLYYRTNAGGSSTVEENEKMPVLVHRAVFGSLERFMGILIEHINGHWPFWLSPRHAVILPINQSKPVLEFTKKVQKELSGSKQVQLHFAPLNQAYYYVDIQADAQSLGKRLRESRLLNYNYEIVIGEREVQEQVLSVTDRQDRKSTKRMTIDELRRIFEEKLSNYE
ncbi:threonine-tRNA ligase [Schizosaccharomyces cryophilus OY26]|uniref:threonine--tRNA ligase n=1 Tax=Schizosaccharomyces cryophilus (strain OY26 / ATCC MYA-4695 / CBS 11777 / NBRC 106824 / NRRL Y48691) TaxID=653667 RepID=S9X8C0_SCHCR|nr:threonine-tRNA ligase [Schizosaccharomyces cryophilus OY26]EPY53337.1 threonine-tRNA ligase [Schizosaccharomyces cryophilus OY26]